MRCDLLCGRCWPTWTTSSSRPTHEDIGKKIDESEFAATLKHRIRDVTCRMRLGAPKVSGKGMGLDPNTVAEYLDNTLSGERVPDFEKVCLESDVHLAEVAACHQILTLVLGEAAEIDPNLRNRMYELGLRVDEPAIETGARGAAAAAAAFSATDAAHRPAEPATPHRERPEVPDYLRAGSRSRFVPIAITVILAVCLLVAIVLAAGGLDSLKMLGLGGKNGQDVAKNDVGHKPPAGPVDGKQADGKDGKAIDTKTPDAKVGDKAGEVAA